MNPITDEKLFFSLYFDTDAPHKEIQAPRDRGEFVMATDCHILIKVDKNLLKEKYEEATKPNLYPIEPNRNVRLNLSQLERAILKYPLEEEEEEIAPAVPCPHCDGEGFVEWQFEDKNGYIHTSDDTCPVCNGTGNQRAAKIRKTGRKFPKYNLTMMVDGIPFNAYYIAVIAESMKQLGISEIYHTRVCEGANPNIFKIAEGIEVILMPILPGEEVFASINGKEVKK